MTAPASRTVTTNSIVPRPSLPCTVRPAREPERLGGRHKSEAVSPFADSRRLRAGKDAMDCRPRRRSWASGPAVVLLALAVLSGCAQPETLPGGSEGRSGHPVDEVAAHRGRPCPKKLPPASTESYGFGVSDPAHSAPALPFPEAAWVCRYDPRDSGPGPDGDGTTVGWVRHGAPRPVPSSRLPALEDQLRELVPAVAD